MFASKHASKQVNQQANKQVGWAVNQYMNQSLAGSSTNEVLCGKRDVRKKKTVCNRINKEREVIIRRGWQKPNRKSDIAVLAVSVTWPRRNGWLCSLSGFAPQRTIQLRYHLYPIVSQQHPYSQSKWGWCSAMAIACRRKSDRGRP